MFKTAVLGPIGAPVSGSCLDCALGRSPAAEFRCHGFGPGCLGYQRRPAEPERMTAVNRLAGRSPLD